MLELITDPQHTCLRSPAQIVQEGLWNGLGATITQMVGVMHQERGIGLAAPQVGVPLRVAVMQVHKSQPTVLINPTLVAARGGKVPLREGCLSLPGQNYLVPRYLEVRVRYQNQNKKWVVDDFKGLEAQCVQHELDHLDGRLIDGSQMA